MRPIKLNLLLTDLFFSISSFKTENRGETVFNHCDFFHDILYSISGIEIQFFRARRIKKKETHLILAPQ